MKNFEGKLILALTLWVLVVFAYHAFLTFNDVGNAPYYTSWVFHDCVSKNFFSVPTNEPLLTAYSVLVAKCSNDSYHYYAPLSDFLGFFLGLKLLFALVFVALFYCVWKAGKGELGLLLYVAAGWNWLTTAIAGGTLAFTIILLLAAFTIAFWRKLSKSHKVLLALIALLTHNLGGWFFVLFMLVMQAFGEKRGLIAATVLSLVALLFTFLFFSNPINSGSPLEYRPVYLVTLFGAILFSRNYYESKVVKREWLSRLKR